MPDEDDFEMNFDYVIHCETLFLITCLANNYSLGIRQAQKIISEDHIKEVLYTAETDQEEFCPYHRRKVYLKVLYNIYICQNQFFYWRDMVDVLTNIVKPALEHFSESQS